jgi:hypothetical protein
MTAYPLPKPFSSLQDAFHLLVTSEKIKNKQKECASQCATELTVLRTTTLSVTNTIQSCKACFPGAPTIARSHTKLLEERT